MQNIFKSHGTLSQQSCPHTNEQNNVAERKHRHILDTIRALLISTSVPPYLWAEAFLVAVLFISVTPSFLLDDTSPHSFLFKSKFDYSSLHTFSCVCFPFPIFMNVTNFPLV